MMLWETYPIELDQFTLGDAYLTLQGDPPAKIPFWVWLFENPDSLLSLPGCIDLYRHDCLHLLLKQGFSPAGEAYVLGFTMGNDPGTHGYHIFIFKLISRFLYPRPYRFHLMDLVQFDQGFRQGQRSQVKALNQLDFAPLGNLKLEKIRQILGL